MTLKVQEMFTVGATPTFASVLERREQKQLLIQSLLAAHPGATLLSCSCNIPGPIKQNIVINRLQQLGSTAIEKKCQESNLSFLTTKHFDLPTGPESYWVLAAAPEHIKACAITVEQTAFGRLLDLDVYYQAADTAVEQVSRVALGFPMRTCYLCTDIAKNCASRRLHSIEALQTHIISLLDGIL